MKSVLAAGFSGDLLQSIRRSLGEEANVCPCGADESRLPPLPGNFDMIVIEQSAGMDIFPILSLLRQSCGKLPRLCILEPSEEPRAAEYLAGGATDYVLKTAHIDLALTHAVRRNLDIRTLSKNAEALENERLTLVKAQKLKQEFLQQISHDLRSPLLTLRTYAQLLASGRLGELGGQQREKIETILRNADRLAHAIDHIRRFERLEVENIELVRAGFDLKDLVTEILVAASRACSEKGVMLGQSWPMGSLGVYADRELIGEVLRELLANAIASTPERGSITVAITERAGGELALSVTDTGCGMSAEEIARLGDPLAVRIAARARGQPGHGLGLAIVRRILDLHRSRFDIDSQPGQGTRVRFTLPMAARPPQNVSPPRSRGRRVVLVVDDDDDNRGCTRTVLEMSGYQVLGASGLDEARTQLEQGEVDAVLLDVAMKGVGGLETLRLLKHYPATSSLPVIMVSGCADDETRAHAARLGAAAYVVKPFVPAKLLRELAAALSPAAPHCV